MKYMTIKGNVGSIPQSRKNANGKEYVAFSFFDNPAKRDSGEKSVLMGVTVYAQKAKEIAASLKVGEFVELHGDIQGSYVTPNFIRVIKRKSEPAPAQAKAE